jgi:hypothetical protein
MKFQKGDLIELYIDSAHTFSAFFEVTEICPECGDVVLRCNDSRMLYHFPVCFTADQIEALYIRSHIPKPVQRPLLEVVK